jgi:hypothetical protein
VWHLRNLTHPNVARFCGLCLDSEKPLCIMEYYPQGSLHDLLRRARGAVEASGGGGGGGGSVRGGSGSGGRLEVRLARAGEGLRVGGGLRTSQLKAVVEWHSRRWSMMMSGGKGCLKCLEQRAPL